MSRLVPWIRLLSGLKYSVVFLVILVGLPLTVFSWMPLHLILGGIFEELGAWDVFWLSIAFFAASWTLMSTTGLAADSLEERRPELGGGPYLPAAAARFLSVPITAGQMLFFSGVALVQVAVVAAVAQSRAMAAVAALAGAAIAYLVQILLAAPAHLAVPDYAPIPRWWLVDAIWSLSRPLRPLAAALYRLASRLFAVLRLREARWPDYFYALTTTTGAGALLVAMGWLFFPPAERFSVSPPAGAYLYLLLLLFIWVFMSLDFYLSRFRISPLVVLLLIMAVVYQATGIDHYYEARAGDGGPVEPPLTPAEVARTSRAPENLVVVASAGGGILAAGWTTLVLQHMLAERPALADEIRLLSTVSGGSVGAAYYADALRKLPDAERTAQGLEAALAVAFDKSTTSSLDATAYGLSILDFERIFIDDALPVLRRWDRGRLLENSWERIAGDAPTLLELRADVRAGRLPALILNSTVMERGHRLMLTQVDFSGVAGVHADTQTEFLGNGQDVDIGLWTAARLSATFPYISPAARSDLDTAGAGEPAARNRAYHLIDGGYYDNFGVTSTFDWLWPVLAARRAGADGLVFRKVVIVRLNPFPAAAPPPPQKGLLSAVAGPLLGLANLRNGSQITRNRAELERGLDSWSELLDGHGVCLGTFEIRPPKDAPEGPLSWRLTPSQIEALRESWDPVVPQWEKVKEFLEQPCGDAP